MSRANRIAGERRDGLYKRFLVPIWTDANWFCGKVGRMASAISNFRMFVIQKKSGRDGDRSRKVFGIEQSHFEKFNNVTLHLDWSGLELF